MIEALHTGMMANVSVGGEVSESFSDTNGVNQGCVLAPTLFSIFLSAMLDEAFRDMGDGIYIESRQNTDLFKQPGKKPSISFLLIHYAYNQFENVKHSAGHLHKGCQ